jgi:flagellar secretion chaperone FliS
MDVGTEYRQVSAHGASKIRLVIALYDQIAQDLCSAAIAMEQKNIEKRTGEIDHALVVLEQLQGRLDFEEGGDIARNLERFYCLVRTRLLAAQTASSAEILREQVGLLLSVRDAWLEVAQIEESKAEPHNLRSLSPVDSVLKTTSSNPGWEA